MPEEIRLLSLWQPWAALVASELKRYETRSWSTKYRGKIAIHAAQRKIDRANILPILYGTGGGGVSKTDLDRLDQVLSADLPRGCIVAIADLTNCLTLKAMPLRSDRFINIYEVSPLEQAVGNWQQGRYAWKLDNVVAMPEPIPFKGSQGLRRIQDVEVLARIDQCLGRVAA